MGVLGVAGGVFSAPQVHHAFRVALGLLTDEEALALRRVDVVDECLPGLEVIADAVRFILVAALLEDGLVLHLARGVGAPHSMHDAAVQVHGDPVGLQFQVGIVHLALAVKVGVAHSGLEGHGVGGRVFHG